MSTLDSIGDIPSIGIGIVPHQEKISGIITEARRAPKSLL
jgi:hypothetical protein